MIDLRSDTVTKPVSKMREAMSQAEVGDDVYGEDPTVNKLEEKVAKVFGRDSGLFVPSGSMGNQVAVNVYTQPGDEIILDSTFHIFRYEMGTMAKFSGVMPHPIYTEGDHLPVERVRENINPEKYYVSKSSLIALENTQNVKGGVVYPKDRAEEVLDLAKEFGIPVHLDGARIFNASISTGSSVKKLTSGFDSVMFCLSKGLGAPVGSMLVGSERFISKARRVRKELGGGMRQVGVLAAAGIYALDNHVDRLQRDHENARLLAEGLEDLGWIDVKYPETNILLLDLGRSEVDTNEFVNRMREHDILVGSISKNKIRIVTHLGITRDDVEKVVEIVKSLY
ncbi:MAG: low-specificity L-threonine aldolase [Candidatus Hadarchaeia archaeon]